MGILIIYAHPPVEGHCFEILKNVEQDLKSKNKEYELIDLYKENYDPVMHADELYTVGNRDISPQNKLFQEKISNSELLILIYPVWWNSPPAILKGFIDKVFTPRFAFSFKSIFSPNIKTLLAKIIPGKWGFMIDFGIPIKLLKGKKAIVFCTSSSPKVATFFLLGNRFKTTMKKDMLGFFGIKTKLYHIDNAKKMNEYQIRRIKKSVMRALRSI
jgi:NAD(P)H dehydrogenase (quinone)